MKKTYFKIIIPNYNNFEWVGRCLKSIQNQTFTDYKLIIVDDCSDEFGVEAIIELAAAFDKERVIPIFSKEKLWNGGARNIGIRLNIPSEYTIFVDSDDCLKDENCLKDLHDFIEANGKPDCIRIQYDIEYEGDKNFVVRLDDNIPEKLVHSIFVACWTKVIKTKLVELFPENTLMEDVVQHIKQCDRLNSVVVFNRPQVFYHHNRNNKNSCSIQENQNCQKGKWQSSMFRYMADLLEIKCEHDYCEKEREKRKNICYENIKKGVYWQ